ncbi:hypothetical protein MMC25_006598 [Agyrium rufum]|nr:hypothetical protein [Agyrium rufum]
MEQHEQAVSKIIESVKAFYARKEPFRIYHGSTNSTRLTTFDPKKIVDTSSLSHVLCVDTTRATVLVEPNVSMDQLVRKTLKHGLMPPVVPEFPGITVGGSFSGTAAESSSFRYGFFDRAVAWCDIVLADGTLVRASVEENPDLFFGAVGAFGTLGVTTLFELRLVPAKKYVRLAYRPIKSSAEALGNLERLTRELSSHDFLDAILFSRDRGVIVTGTMTDDISSVRKTQRFSRPHDPWFYLHAEQRTSSDVDIVPIEDYLFRYDRGGFWMGRHSFHSCFTPFNRFMRFVFNPLMHTRKLYEQLHASGHAQRFMIQDLTIPKRSAQRFLEYVDEKLDIYPLWLCPIRADAQALMHTPFQRNTDLLINIGVWGPRWGDFEDFKMENRELETSLREVGGMKWLYAHTYYTEEEFWGIYDREGYEALRAKYGATTLPNICQKVKSSEVFQPTSEWKGIFKALFGRATLLRK